MPDFLVSGTQLVHPEYVRNRVDGILLGDAARIVGRHRADDRAVERSRRLAVPRRPERVAAKWRSPPALCMTRRAGLEEERFAAFGLRIGVTERRDRVRAASGRLEAGQRDAFRGCDSERNPARAVALAANGDDDELLASGEVGDRPTGRAHG